MTYRQELWDIAATQHAIITTRDADEADIPPVELRKLASRGALDHVARGVYRHRQVPTTRFTQPAAAVAAVGPGAHLDWDAVLSLYQLALVNPATIQITTPRRFRGTLPPHIRLTATRRPRDAEELTHHEGIPGLTVRAALEEAARRIPHDRVRTATEAALARELLTPTEHQAILSRLVTEPSRTGGEE